MTSFPRIFDTSTGHLRPSDHSLLERLARGEQLPGSVPTPVICYEIGEYGFMVRTDGGKKSAMSDQAGLVRWREEKVAAMKEAGFSDEFVALMRHAWENDAVFLSLDRDNEPEPGFPLFDAVTGEMYDDGSGEEPSAPAP